MAKRILNSSKPQPNHHHNHQKPQQQQQQHQQQQQQSQSGPRSLYNRGRIAPMASSRSEVNLQSLRMPDGGHHPSLEHFGGNGNHNLTMAKTKVWYHSQRDFQHQEASVWYLTNFSFQKFKIHLWIFRQIKTSTFSSIFILFLVEYIIIVKVLNKKIYRDL